MLEMDHDFAPAVVIRHALGVSFVFFRGVRDELLSGGTFHTKTITVPGGNFHMPRVVGWDRNTFARERETRCPLNEGTCSRSPRGLHFWQGSWPKAMTAHRYFLNVISNGIKVKHRGKEAQTLAAM